MQDLKEVRPTFMRVSLASLRRNSIGNLIMCKKFNSISLCKIKLTKKGLGEKDELKLSMQAKLG